MKLFTITVLFITCLCSAFSFNNGRVVQQMDGIVHFVWLGTATSNSDETAALIDENKIPQNPNQGQDSRWINRETRSMSITPDCKPQQKSPNIDIGGKRAEMYAQVPEFRLISTEELL